MYISRLMSNIRLLDIKTLCEYYAYTCSKVGTFTYEAPRYYTVVNTYEEFSDLGKPFFDLMIRISLLDMKAYFTSFDLCSIDSFFTRIASSEFWDFVRKYSSDLYDVEYLEDKWNEEKVQNICTLFTSDMERYCRFIEHLRVKTTNGYLAVISGDDSILGIYSNLPELQEGLVRRSLSSDKFHMFSAQPHLLQNLTIEFTQFCNNLHFMEDKNYTTVVYKYLASQMQYFISQWFKTIQSMYTVGKVGTTVEDGRVKYFADMLSLKDESNNIEVNLYDVFENVNRVDSALFKRIKGGGYSQPYKSIIDILLPMIEPDTHAKIGDLESIKHDSPVLESCTFVYAAPLVNLAADNTGTVRNALPLVSRDALLASTDASFRAKIAANVKLIKDIYDVCQDLKPETFHDTIYKIVSSHCECRTNKDSDIPYVKFSTPAGMHSQAELGIYSESKQSNLSINTKYAIYDDQTYAQISDIIATIGKVVELSSALQLYGTSLSMLWSQYLMHYPNREILVFQQCSTIPAILNCLGINNSKSTVDYSDGLAAEVRYAYITQSLRNEIFDLLKVRPKSAQTKVNFNLSLGHARVPVKSDFTDKKAIVQLYQEFISSNSQMPTDMLEQYMKCFKRITGESRVGTLANAKVLSTSTRYIFTENKLSISDFCWNRIVAALDSITEKTYSEYCAFFSSDEYISLMLNLQRWVSLSSAAKTQVLHILAADVEDTSLASLKEFAGALEGETALADGSSATGAFGYWCDLDVIGLGSYKSAKNMFNKMYVFFALIYMLTSKSVDLLKYDYDLSPLSNRDFIIDISFSMISLFDSIAELANAYAEIGVRYQEALSSVKLQDLLPKITNQKDKSPLFFTDVAYALLSVGKSYALQESELVDVLKQSSDIAFGQSSSAITRLDRIKASLTRGKIFFAPIINSVIRRATLISEIFSITICGALRLALDALNNEYLQTYRHIHQEEDMFRNYIRDALSLTEIKQPLYNSNASKFEFRLSAQLFENALFTDEYLTAKKLVQFTSESTLHSLRLEVQNYALDGSFYRKPDGTYVHITNKTTGIMYFLSKDLVYVGRLANGKVDVHAASEINIR